MTPRTATSHMTLELAKPSLSARWIPEPMLGFADRVEAIDPKIGIPLAGPKSYGTSRHPNPIHIGFIGTASSVDRATTYLQTAVAGIDGDDDHHPFPGVQSDRGFRTELRISSDLTRHIGVGEMRSLMAEGCKQRDRFEELLATLEDRLSLLCDTDHPLDCVYVVLPEDLYRRCRVADYTEGGRKVHRDLRAAFKAMAMRYRMPTQMMKESTAGLTTETGPRKQSHPADVAWNLLTGLYFKAGGFPWGPVGLPTGTCFVGVSFFHPLGESSNLRASVAQAFSESGDAFVLRGNEFTWDGRSPHLPPENAKDLIAMTLDRYQREYGRRPAHVVVQKPTWFHPDEKEGFHDALEGIRHDLVALRPAPDVRVLRHAQYPPPRGTVLTFGDRHYLYATGTMPELGFYPHGHVPTPIQISDHVGDASVDQVLADILLLTKMNWNSARYAESQPITTRFARRVGEILKEIGADEKPEAKYGFYM